jgi:tetratricopeptide (TPR) repeat protein
MNSLLKALGVTIWGTIAFGLLTTFVLVGYRAGIRYSNLHSALVDTAGLEDKSTGNRSVSHSRGGTPGHAIQDQRNSASGSGSIAVDPTHALFRDAADQHQYDLALAYGKQLVDTGNAGPDDLRIIAQAYYSTKDCTNALTLIDTAIDAFRAANREPDESLQQIKTRCESEIRGRHGYINADQLERTMRLLNSLNVRAEADRKNLLQLEEDAAKSTSGNLDVALGERYFGYRDYQLAIASIERGLEKGQVTHLDDAYVYLGRSQVAIGNTMEARSAFAKLKDVPNMSPRVLRLWELYAETLK